MSTPETNPGTELIETMRAVGLRARKASWDIAKSTTSSKNKALLSAAAELESRQADILAANARDMEAGRARLDVALLDRLELTPSRIQAMADGLRQVATLPDPIGEITGLQYRPSGIQVGRMRVPIGVIGIIYESRPNVTADAAALGLKSGNAVILRGGSEAVNSNRILASCLQSGLEGAGLPAAAVQLIDTTDRAAVDALVAMSDYVDLIIPRGGKGLIERVSAHARMPVLKHLDGICHVYIDDEAAISKAVSVAYNAKTQRYGTCNTMETLLVARAVAPRILAELAPMYREAGVELRGCVETCRIIEDARPASEADWTTEYLAPILSIAVVSGLDEAIAHIRKYGSQHTDAIVTENLTRARRFLTEVDSSSVMVNASTRFADGYEYGLGAEVGISTDKFHARGPVGLEGLTSQKFIVIGDGHVRT